MHFPTRPICPPAPYGAHDGAHERRRDHTHGTERAAAPVYTSSSSIAILITHRHGAALLTRLVPGARHGAARARVLSSSISATPRVGHAPSFVRVANVDATPALVLSRAHASAHDGALHSRTSLECAAPPLNGAIFLRCENMNASPNEGGNQRSLEVIRGHPAAVSVETGQG